MNKRQKPISFYPLKFDEVISDVLKVKPERKHIKPKIKAARGKRLSTEER